MTDDLPLSGLLVVALEQAVAAPFATARLADAGARVLKLERPEGDFARGYDDVAAGQSSYFVWLNRGKESVTMDLGRAEDRALFEALIARADVFVQNLKPGALAKLGYPVEALCATNPRLVACSISGYGESGELASRKAYDLLIQAESGLASITGGPDAPARVGVSIVDIATGATAAQAIMEALFARERSGCGADIRLSMFDVMVDWMAVPFLHAAAGRAPKRIGLAHPSISPYGVFTTRDGKPILISIQNEREWAQLCARVLDDPGFATDARFVSNVLRVQNRAATDARVQAGFARHDKRDLVTRLAAADIAFASVNEMSDLLTHPALSTVCLETPGGDVDAPRPAAQFAGARRGHLARAGGIHGSAIVSDLDLAFLKTWEGRSELARDSVSPWLASAFRATLDLPAGDTAPGSAAPQGIHWCLALPTVATSELGQDGHAARGGFLPPVPLPRRMWAGGRVRFVDALRIGDDIARRSTVKSVALKDGRTGRLVFVLVEHRIETPRGLAIVEEHDIVYRGADAPAVRPSGQMKVDEAIDAERVIDPTPALLFRYSALTFNAHRIHYDQPYVTREEGYPGLIVHGPLQATLLIQLGAEMAGAPLAHFEFRATKPLFDLAPFTIAGRWNGGGLELWAADAAGERTMAASAS